MIIDATNMILGRVATVAAKKALEGEKVEIINAEKAIITGKRSEIVANYTNRRKRGNPFHGPIIRRTPHMFVKRAIRGMLPYKKERGKTAFKKITCHKGVPETLKDKKSITLNNSGIEKLQTAKYMTVEQLTKELGAKER